MIEMHRSLTRSSDETTQPSAKLDILLHRILHVNREHSTSAAGLFPFNGTLLFKVICILLADMVGSNDSTCSISLSAGVWHCHVPNDSAPIPAVGN